MPIQVCRYKTGEHIKWGVVNEGYITALNGQYNTTGELLTNGRTEIEHANNTRTNSLSIDSVDILSPITEHQQLICQGVNYSSHLKESGFNPNKVRANVLFRKASSSMCGAYSDIRLPKKVELLDYEAELGLVLGAEIKQETKIMSENLHEFVAGVVIHNDISARDIQITEPTGQFYKGKSFRTFGPTGPYLVLLSENELRRIDDLYITLTVDDDQRQNSLCREMVFKPEQTLSELSCLQDLYPGDLIATGTPGGVALKAPSNPLLLLLAKFLSEEKKWEIFKKKNKHNPRYLQVGQTIRTKIETNDGQISLGEQVNKVVGHAS